MPVLLLLILLYRLGQATPCITVNPSGPFIVPLTNGIASMTLNISLCPPAPVTVSTLPPRLAPSLSVQPISTITDDCQTSRATLVFWSEIGSGKLVLATPTCSAAVRIVVAGVVAYHLPSRDRVTSHTADPVPIPPIRRRSVGVFFAVKAVLPTGQVLRARKAVGAVRVKLSPLVTGVTASLGIGKHSGNLQIVSTDDGSDVPRPQVEQTVKLRLGRSDVSSSFRILHPPLAATVRAVRAPKLLAPIGGEQITLVVRRAAADMRRLIIGNITVSETEYVRSGSNYLSSFTAPPLQWGKHEWRLEIVTGGKVTIAKDISGHTFIVAARPRLTALLPAIVKPHVDGFVMLLGMFADSVTVLVDGSPPLESDIVYKATGEIIMRIPPTSATFNGTMSISLKPKRGKKSNTLELRFDPDAIYVDAVVLHASTDLSTGRFVIPFLCNRSEPPVVLARVDAPQDAYEPPVFNYSIRQSVFAPTFEPLSSGLSGMVSLNQTFFGDHSDLNGDFVVVRILVTRGGRSGETLVFISRQIRRDVIGATVLPPFDAQRGSGHTILRAHVIPLAHCHNAFDLETKTKWSVNETSVIPVGTDNADVSPGLDTARVAGLGRTLLVPDEKDFSYFAEVTVTNRLTGKTVASGNSGDRRRLRGLPAPLQTLLNGGLRSATLPPGLEFYEIYSSVHDLKLASSFENARYIWTCKQLSLDVTKCPETLFPLAARNTEGNTRFNISTIDVKEGTVIEYFLTVRLGDRVGNSRLRLSVGTAEVSFFPSSQLSTGTTPPEVLSDGSIQFPCYQHIILSVLDPKLNDSYTFALFRERNATNILETSADDLLVSHNGYWSRQQRSATLLGILPNKLESANYTLYGASDGKAEPGRGASWRFRIQRCPVLIPHELPILIGAAGLTTFFAGATSVPPSNSLFFFEILREGDTSPNTNRSDSTNYIRGCSGGELCTFLVPTAGRYFVRIDMYDPSGTRILSSKRLDTPIAVRVPNATESQLAANDLDTAPAASTDFVGAALLQEDESAFLYGVLQLAPEEPLEPRVLEDIVAGLLKLASSPILVPRRGSHILAACSHLLLFSQVHDKLKYIEKIRRVAELTIARSLSIIGPATALRNSGADFYSVLLRTSANFVRAPPDGEQKAANENLAEISRRSAASHIPLILATGRECGFLDRLVVNYPMQTRVNVSSGTPMVAKFDDYRIGINCFRGQVTQLLPQPATVEQCFGQQSDPRLFRTPQILVSSEQHDLTDEPSKTELISGPFVQTRVLTIQNGNNTILLENDDQPCSTCYRTRVAVYVSKDLAEDLVLSTRGEMNITCESGEQPVSSFDIEASSESSTKSSASTFTIGSDGRIGTFLEAKPPVTARMTVNGTQLRECIAMARLEGRSNLSTSAVVFAVLGSLGLFVLVLLIAWLWIRRRHRDKFSVPESVVPWDSFEISASQTRSTMGPYYYDSGEGHQTRNDTQTQDGVPENGQKSGTEIDETVELESERTLGRVSGSSALEEWEPTSGSRLSSLLTATDSYTTSSGDLSGLGAGPSDYRSKLQSAAKSLPGFYVPSRNSNHRPS